MLLYGLSLCLWSQEKINWQHRVAMFLFFNVHDTYILYLHFMFRISYIYVQFYYYYYYSNCLQHLCASGGCQCFLFRNFMKCSYLENDIKWICLLVWFNALSFCLLVFLPIYLSYTSLRLSFPNVKAPWVKIVYSNKKISTNSQ